MLESIEPYRTTIGGLVLHIINIPCDGIHVIIHTLFTVCNLSIAMTHVILGV